MKEIKVFKRFLKLKNIVNIFEIIFIIFFIFFENIIWEKIAQPIYNKFKSLNIINEFKIWASAIEHRYALLLLFLMPFILMEVFSLIAIYLISKGYLVFGTILYIIKILMTVFVSIIFNAGKEKLISFFIIKYSYGAILNFKRSSIYRKTKNSLKLFKLKIKKRFSEFKSFILNY